MERLTDYHVGENCAYMMCSGNCSGNLCEECEELEKIINRLAAYEDTGLSPETVSDLLERFSYFYRTVEGLDIVDPVHFGAFVDRVKRWQQAEKDGRLVVLPCKVGDILYAGEDRPVIPVAVTNVGLVLDGPGGEDWESLSNIGKTVFLTREEAEAALKKREGR